MPLNHLVTNRHYRVSITSPVGELWAAHIQYQDDGRLRVAMFIKDEEAIDQSAEVLYQAVRANERDARGELRAKDDTSHVWDWNEAKWQLSTRLESPPQHSGDDLDYPF